MLDEYIIMNRKPKMILYLYFFFLFLFIIMTVYGTCFLFQKCIFQFHSKVLYNCSQYYLEVQVPLDAVHMLKKKGIISIDSKNYHYSILKTSDMSFYQNNRNYIYVTLIVYQLDEKYLYDGYEMDIVYFSG